MKKTKMRIFSALLTLCILTVSLASPASSAEFGSAAPEQIGFVDSALSEPSFEADPYKEVYDYPAEIPASDSSDSAAPIMSGIWDPLSEPVTLEELVLNPVSDPENEPATEESLSAEEDSFSDAAAVPVPEPERLLTPPSPQTGTDFSAAADEPADESATQEPDLLQSVTDHVYLTTGESLSLPFTRAGMTPSVICRIVKENDTCQASWDEAWSEDGRSIGLTLTGTSEGDNTLLILLISAADDTILSSLTLPVTVLPGQTDADPAALSDAPAVALVSEEIDADMDAADVSAASLQVGEYEDILLGYTYNLPVRIVSDENISFTLNASGGTDLFNYSWGEWNKNYTQIPLRLRSFKEGKTTLTLSLKDVKTGKIVATQSLVLTARGAIPDLKSNLSTISVGENENPPVINLQIVDAPGPTRLVFECKGDNIVYGSFGDINDGKVSFTPEITGAGKTELVFTLMDTGSDVILGSVSIKVTVKESKAAKVTASVQKLELAVGETVRVKLTTPSYADDMSFFFIPTQHLDADFVSGARTTTGTSLDFVGLKAGKGTFTIKLRRGVGDQIKNLASLKIPYVIKKAKAGSFVMSAQVLELALNKTADLTLDYGKRPADSVVNFSFSSKEIAQAAWVGKNNQKLRLTGKKAGTVTLTVRMQNKAGSKTYATQTCLINVRKRSGNITVDDLSYTFDNSDTAFSSRYPYAIPYRAFRTMFGDNALARRLAIINVWTGNCMGMSSTAMMICNKVKGFTAADFRSGAVRPLDLKTSDMNGKNDITLAEFIEAMQIMQSSSLCNSRRLDDDLNLLLSELRAGRTAVFSYYWVTSKPGQLPKKYAGHSVLAYALDESQSGKAIVYYYDPNFPQDASRQVTFYLDKKAPNGFDHFETLFNSQKIVSEEKEMFNVITSKSIEEIWNNRGKLVPLNQNLLSASGSNLDIYNAEGRLVGSVRDGEVVSDSIGIIEMTDKADHASSDLMQFYLPTGSWRIVSLDGADYFRASMTNIDQDASVTTTGDIIEFNVNDSDQLNEVQIEMEKGDTYHVELQSTLNGKNSSVSIGGVSEGETTLIRSKNGQVETEGAGKAVMDDDSGNGEVLSLTAESGYGGDIYPSGNVPVAKGGSQEFVILPDPDWEIASLRIDGKKTEVKDTYTFKDVTEAHTISAAFRHRYHTMDEGTLTREPTIKKTGKVVYRCTECGEKLWTETLPKLNPTFTVIKQSVTVKVGERMKDTLITGLAKGDSIVSWACADKKIAGVSQKGVIKGKQKGTTTVTATLKSGVTINIKVKVKK